MAVFDVIQYKLDRLINVMINDGIQPGDLADNIFLKDYKQISYKKNGDNIIGELLISESEGSYETEYTLRYVYTQEKKIMRIEEERLGKVIVQWDRNNIETELINDIVYILKLHYTQEQMNNFLSTLPEKLSSRIINIYFEVA